MNKLETGKISYRQYFNIVGRPPAQDDLERVNCDCAGKMGHESCGLGVETGMPRWMGTFAEKNTNTYIGTKLSYSDPEAPDEQKITEVSHFMAARAFNELCKMIGGRWPDAQMEQEAPEAYAFFMDLIDESPIKA